MPSDVIAVIVSVRIHAVCRMLKLLGGAFLSILSHVKDLKYPVSGKILWKDPDEIPFITWASLNGQRI